MAKITKRKKEKIEEIEELDVRIVKAWKRFVEEATTTLDQAEVYANLAFEREINGKTYSFCVDEIIFPEKVSFIDDKLVVEVTYGTDIKYISFADFDLVNATRPDAHDDVTMWQIVTELMQKHFSEIEEVNSPRDLFRLIEENPGLDDLLNDYDFVLKMHEKKVKNKSKYEKLPNYGIF